MRSFKTTVQPRDRSLRYENERSALAEEGVLRLMYLDPALLDGKNLTSADFSSPLLGRLFEILQEKIRENAAVSMASLSGSFTAEEINHITAILQKPEVLTNGKKALEDYIEIIKSEREAATAGDDLRAFAEKMRNKKGYGG